MIKFHELFCFLLLICLSLAIEDTNVAREQYHPDICNVTRYELAFIRDNNKLYKVHGLWPDICDECTECGFPNCCNMEKFSHFNYPNDTQFIDDYWFAGEDKHPSVACEIKTKTLFQHEVLKHGSCMGLFSDEYVEIVKKLYFTYHDYANKMCHEKHECSIRLNADFSLDE